MTRIIRAPRGTQLTCKNWLIEAPYRMIQHNLEPEVAGDPQNLIVYGGRGRAARNWDCFDAILEALRNLEPDETLLVQSGKPVGVFTTHEDAPRVVIANTNIVPAWATQENFDRWEAEGLIMYGQMTAGSWIYIGTQGILQGTYETLAAAARKHFGEHASLRGKFVLTAGLGEMGGAQPLAVTMNEGVALVVEIDPWRAQRRLDHRYLDVVVDNLEEAMSLVQEAVAGQEPQEHWPDRQCGRRVPRAGGARHHARHCDRSDLRPRPADVCAQRHAPGRSRGVAPPRSQGVSAAVDAGHGRPLPGDGRDAKAGGRGLGLWQQPAPDGL